MTKVKHIGNHTYQRLSNEEALAKYGSSLVFVGTQPAKPISGETKKLKTDVQRSRGD